MSKVLGRMLRYLVDFRCEPVRAVARITSAVTALATIAALWGFPISDQTQTAILTTAPTLIVVLNGAAEFMRQFVSPVPVVHDAIRDAMMMDPRAGALLPTPAQVLQDAS